MKCLTLLALLFLATLAYAQAGKVTIKGECVNCSHGQTTTTTTHKPSSKGIANGGRATAKPKSKSPSPRRPTSSEEGDDDLAGGWSLHQTAGGSQYIGRRSKRQWGGQYIDLGGSGGRGAGGGGGWSGGGVTTIDSRGYPGGTLVRNSDCVGCNIRG
ncbi:bomanin Bicipital 1 [Drosophila biarmipes]|uniref:bomanin Bicipital 1 n=1 Tax=Drosophila biarmipes TaxID=125945 RepID=UPI0007E67ABA|nr:bomanin Bicipital 1 [Drosophila biarmipes]